MSLERPGDLDRDSRKRKPTKGIRQRLRKCLKEEGVVGKFRTDEARDGTLMIIGRTHKIETTLIFFEGRKVKSIVYA